MKKVVLLGAALAAGAFAVSAFDMGTFVTMARAQDAPQGDAVNGKRAYLASGCMYCHGRAGQGGGMNYPTPPLAKTALPIEGFKGVVRQSMRDMPAYTEAVLPEKDLTDIFAFVQSLPGRRPAKDIAILND
jgi:mono/diheme cytochrome c family protein